MKTVLLDKKQFSKKFERSLRILGFLDVLPRLSSDLDWSLFIKRFLVENIVYCVLDFNLCWNLFLLKLRTCSMHLS